MFFYITADRIGIQTGGGKVTHHELEAMRQMGHPVSVYSIMHDYKPKTPFEQDEEIFNYVRDSIENGHSCPKVVHCYAGCLSKTLAYLKSKGCRITYTAAAHSVEESRKEHVDLGIDFDTALPHLVQPDLWKQYLTGYMLSDILICPSTHSQKVMRGYFSKFGYDTTIKVIPHGIDFIENHVYDLPSSFALGYMGAIGPDKGLKYLLQAWKHLSYKDAILYLAGKDTTSSYCEAFVRHYGGGVVQLMGWVERLEDFYKSITCYVQPSVSEGFGIEVLEAMNYGRPVICSDGAGACDLVPLKNRFAARNVAELVNVIDYIRHTYHESPPPKSVLYQWKGTAKQYQWENIYKMYQMTWGGLLN